MAICRNASELFMYTLNSLTLIFGILIVAISAFVLTEIEDDFDELDVPNAIVASLVFGVGLIVFSVIGLCGTCYDNSCLLLIYIIGLFVLGAGVFASGIVLLVFGGRFENVADGQVDNNVEEKILDFQLAIFNQCCGSQTGVIDARACSDPLSFNPCYEDEEQFEAFVELIDEDTCKVLERLELDGTPLVGDVTEFDGRCGNGFALTFVKNINEYIQENLRTLGIANLVAGIVLLLLLVAACVVLWTKNEEKRKAAQQSKKGGCF